MKPRILVIVGIVLSFLVSHDNAHAAFQLPPVLCNSFLECERAGLEANGQDDLPRAFSYYVQACPMKVEKVYSALKVSACDEMIRISGELDNYKKAHEAFQKRCEIGDDEGCFFLARLEAQRGNLETAIELFSPLCKARFSIHDLRIANACQDLHHARSKWRSVNPSAVREGPLQVGSFFATLLLPLIALVLLWYRRFTGAVIASSLAFASYTFYETGILVHYNIRIDLLFVWPALFLAAITFVTVLVLAQRKMQTAPMFFAIAGIGFILWMALFLTTGTEAWDTGFLYLTALVIVSAIAGALKPRQFWLWPVALYVGQAVYIVFTGYAVSDWMIGLMVLALFTVLSFVAAALGAGIRVATKMANKAQL